jgi:hypothetical protein
VSRWVPSRAMRPARLASVPLHTFPKRVDCSDNDLSPTISQSRSGRFATLRRHSEVIA